MAKERKRRPSGLRRTVSRVILGSRAENREENAHYDSPSQLAVKRFFRKPLAVGALAVLAAMFLFVFIGPLLDPVDLNYSETLHANIGPNMSMGKLPDAMQQDPVSIQSQSAFSLGLDREGNVHAWGYYHSFYTDERKNVLKVPKEVEDAHILFAAAGTDHCIAIDDTGKIYGWGESANAQYGNDPAALGNTKMPDALIHGGVDAKNVAQLTCGDQMTALLMKDGTLYAWGNAMAKCMNFDSMMLAANRDGVHFVKVGFTTGNLYALTQDGKFFTGSNSQFSLYQGQDTQQVIGDRKVTDMAVSGDKIVLLLSDGQLLHLGFAGEEAQPENLPQLQAGERVVSISAGSRHFVLVTDTGRAVAWGSGELGQLDVPKELTQPGSVDRVFASGFQNYAFQDGKLVDFWGLKGYLMGTDHMGRSIFNRVMGGGKMTMTIGAVAVIVSSVIGILVGCISGYFGGWADLLLMRVTEIFSAIPFLPFALVLSAVLQGSDLNEDTRIFIIMIILGLLSWTGLAKLVRGQILAEREKEFVLAARSMGVKEGRIAFKHILPNVISVILVSLTLDFASCMLTESSLSYLGFGVKLPRPTWGNMLDGCRSSLVIQNYWWRWVFPALFLAVTVICINIIGDTLRDILDPKSEVEK